MVEKKTTRRQFSSSQKAEILKKNLAGKKSVSDLADEYNVQPSVIYGWLKQVMDNLPALADTATTKRKSNEDAQLRKRVQALEARLSRKDEVIADISEEHVKLKKELGVL